MTYTQIAFLPISLMLLVLAVVILAGKGDSLIAGYNTASEEERKKYYIKRVRVCIGGLLLVIATIMPLSAGNVALLIATTLPLSLLAIILANTWARK